jgi:hypothetical protein
MLSTMPRSTAHRASSLRLQWLSGSWLSSDGCSQANATIAQICSGVNVAGAPGRGASANRWATGAASSAARQRHSQCRTVFGQTRDLPNASSPRRQQDQLGAFGQFPRRAMGANQTGQRLLVSGSHDNGIGAKTWHWTSANQRTSSGFAMPFRSPIDSPSRAAPERYGLFS